MYKQKILVTILVMITATICFGQDKTYIFFNDALSLTNSQNLSLKALEHEHQGLIYEKKAASGVRMPQFNLAANYTLMDKSIGFDFNNMKEPIGQIIGQLPAMPELQPYLQQIMSSDWALNLQENNFGLFGATMVAPIYMGGKINALNNAAKIRIEESETKTEQEKARLNTELVERYFGLSLSQQVAQVRKEVVDGMQKHYNDALSLERNGMIAKGERLYAEMFLSKSKAEFQKSQRDIVSINSALSNTLNAHGNYKPISNMFILTHLEPCDFFVHSALTNSPLLKQVDLKKELANEQMRAKRAELLPTVSAIGAANIADYQVTNILPRAMIGVMVNYKLFNGLKNVNEFRASKESIKMVDIIKKKAESDIATLIEKSYNELISIGEMAASYNETIKFAEEYLRVKTRAFNEGMAKSSDVVDAQLNLAKSKIEVMQLAYQYDVALAKILEVCGLSHTYSNYIVAPQSKAITY